MRALISLMVDSSWGVFFCLIELPVELEEARCGLSRAAHQAQRVARVARVQFTQCDGVVRVQLAL